MPLVGVTKYSEWECGLHISDAFGFHDYGTVDSNEATAIQAFCDFCHSHLDE
jgi:hypothetical protein